MAEGWANFLHADVLEALSAGVESHGLSPIAVEVMAESGVDISRHSSKLLESLAPLSFEAVITVCDHAQERCPIFPGDVKVIHQNFDDPPRLAANVTTEAEAKGHYRRVRDEIREFVMTLPALLSQ